MRLVRNWKVAALSLTCFTVLVYLGLWQVDRAQQQSALLEAQRAMVDSPWRALGDLPTPPPLGMPVRLNGRYLAEPAMLVERRRPDGVGGFEVLGAFHDEVSNQAVIVHRGFVATSSASGALPIVPRIVDQQEVLGHIFVKASARTEVPRDVEDSRIVPLADSALLEQRLGRPLYPYMVRLGVDDANALRTRWSEADVFPGKHIGYAVQWFLMAMMVAVAYGYFSIRGSEEETRQ